MARVGRRTERSARSAIDRRALFSLVVAALAVLLMLVAVLSQSAQHRSGTNGVTFSGMLADLSDGGRVCQTGELLPAGTAAIQLQPKAVEARAVVTVTHRGQVLDRTTVPVGSKIVVVPIRRPAHDIRDVEVCLTHRSGSEILVSGAPRPPNTGFASIDGRRTNGSMPITYLRPGKESWWSYAGTAIARMGMGRGSWGGSWVVWLALFLLASSLALTTWVVLRTIVADEGLRRVRAIAWTVVAIGALNAASWSIVTPTFQVPDEQTHIAYVQQVGESGRPPVHKAEAMVSPELRTILADLRFGELYTRMARATVSSGTQQQRLKRDLDAGLTRHGNGDAGPADPEPPLYYAVEAIPYRLASGATLLDRIALMRLFSALMAGLTTLLVFLFVRECLPRRPWAWSVGGLGAAFVPLLGFISGGVNPDALLFAVSAALLFCLARAFRRGLDTRLAIWIGVVLAIGVIAKINFYGLVPGAIVAVALAARRSEGAWSSRSLRLVGIAVGIGLGAYVLLTTLDAVAWHRPFILARTPAEAPVDHGDLGGQFSYLWQVFLPRLPGQHRAFAFYPPYELWFKGFIGSLGWLAIQFPAWVYDAALGAFAAIGALAVRALVRNRAAVRLHRAELAGYLLITCSLLLLIGMVALRGFAPGIEATVQARYLLPLLALFGAILALAARGAGERWGRSVGVAIVMTAIAWTIFSQLLTISFFYG
jgi:hypothetical protein